MFLLCFYNDCWLIEEILIILFIFLEALFGVAPFSSRSYAELERKIRSSEQITVSVKLFPPLRNGAHMTANGKQCYIN